MPKRHLNELAIKALPCPTTGQTDYWDATLPRFGVRVSYGGNKTYILNIHKKRLSLGKIGYRSLKDAREEARRLLAEKYVPSEHLTTKDLITAFLAAKSLEYRPNTLRVYQLYLPRIEKPLSKLDAQYLYSILPTGQSAANLCFKIFKSFLSWCVERGYLTHNCLIKRRAPNKTKSRDRLLSDTEVQKIWRESFNHGEMGSLVRLLLLTGQRKAQILALQPEWISEGRITFPQEYMKGGKEHSLPLTPLVKKYLTTFTLKDTQSSMVKFRAALNIPHFTLHDARRFHSSFHAKIGTPIHLTERILDHRTGSETAISRVYNRHSYENEIRTALLHYEQQLLKLVGEPAT